MYDSPRRESPAPARSAITLKTLIFIKQDNSSLCPLPWQQAFLFLRYATNQFFFCCRPREGVDVLEKGGGDGPKGEEGCVGVFKFKTKKHENERVKTDRERKAQVSFCKGML